MYMLYMQLLFGQAPCVCPSGDLPALPTPLLMEAVVRLRDVNEKQCSVACWFHVSLCRAACLLAGRDGFYRYVR